MSVYDMHTDQIVHRAGADTDCTILILGGAALALVEDGDDECIGYYQWIGEGEYVHLPYHGYSYYVEDGELRSTHGKPDDMQELTVNDGSQKIAYYGGALAALVAPDMRTYDVRTDTAQDGSDSATRGEVPA